MKRICLDCNHACHCVGQGFYTQNTNCYVMGCVCVDCNHVINEIILNNGEDLMAKKIAKWVWNIICWPWKKLVEWLWTR